MKAHNHYEAAFEHLLLQRALPYVAVDEKHRAAFADVSLKSFDFIVYHPHRQNLLVDIKGRKAQPGKKDWLFDPWVSRDDLEALTLWQNIFGKSFIAAFVFAFWLEDLTRITLFDPFSYREKYYQFYAVYLDDFVHYHKPRSPKWDTLTIPRKVFHQLAWNIDPFLADLSGESLHQET